MVKRVEIDQDDVNVVFRVDGTLPTPDPASPSQNSFWQDCGRVDDATLGVLGAPSGSSDDMGRVFYRTPVGVFAFTKPVDGEPASGANGGTIGFAASSPAQVDAWHAAGLASGGTAC